VRIVGELLRYSNFGIIFRDQRQQLVYRARSVDGQVRYQLKAIDAESMSLVQKVCDVGEPIRVKDIRGRHTFQPLSESTRSVMVVPMSAHGAVNGALTVESSFIDAFTEHDLQMLSIVARSGALALENAELHKRTEELTIIDALTETYNYRYFVRKLQEEKRRAARYNLPLSLIMVDIDWFKKLNDTYGHEAGNVVLKALAGVINGCIRDVDIFARYGGEEFAIILPQTPLREAKTIGERIRERVELTVIDTGSTGKLRITVSVGVSSFPENGRSQEDLVTVTDQALYRAKGEGRNHVCVI
jgi:diguanylate cyclase (GGDEF)-like protein